jgi:jumonji domain-containing protein 7
MAVLSKRLPHPRCASLIIFRYAVLTCFVLLTIAPRVISSVPVLNSNDVQSLTESKCVVAIANNGLKQTTQGDGTATELLSYVDVAFKDEPTVFVGLADLQKFVWPNGKRLESSINHEQTTAVVFPRLVEDRTCLQKPNYFSRYPNSFPYTSPVSAERLVDFINSHCNTFRKSDGSVTIGGLHREYLLNNLFSVKDAPNSLTMAEIFGNLTSSTHDGVCMKDDEDGRIVCNTQDTVDSRKLFANAAKCERISMPSKEEFLQGYLFQSKPVIITGAIDHWPALSKWTQDFLRNQYGEKEVHIKLTPKGEYEGVEPARIWENYDTFQIPQKVLEHLLFSDLVVVRPAGLNMNFSEFIDLMHNISEGQITNVSAYLEYTTISSYFPELLDDLEEILFFRDVLNLSLLNIWLSDGNTLGKTHFDPYDNFLCQV